MHGEADTVCFREQVNDEIIKITKVNHNGKLENFRGPLYLGIPNRAQVRDIARKYYLGE